MACCITAPSHYLNRCWLIITEVLWHSPEGNYTGNAQGIFPWYKSPDLRLHPQLPQQMSSWRYQSSSPSLSLEWCHNERDGVSNHWRLDSLSNRLFKSRSKKTSKLPSLACVRGIHRWPMDSPYKGPVTRNMFPFDDVNMILFIPIFFVQFTDKCLSFCPQIF